MQIPSFRYEHPYWQQGLTLVAGLDEVGMGAWAGPVVAGAVVFSPDKGDLGVFPVIRDSKTLSPQQREKTAAWIKNNALAWAVGEASVEEIFELNILQAARLAMKRAVAQLQPPPEMLLVDGRGENIHPTISSQSIVKGDQQSFSIAAASIVAKVHRDQLMGELAVQFPGYGFEQHKGYGSAAHQAALRIQGVSACHRRAYAPIAALVA